MSESHVSAKMSELWLFVYVSRGTMMLPTSRKQVVMIKQMDKYWLLNKQLHSLSLLPAFVTDDVSKDMDATCIEPVDVV